jgi:coproporphyrinogen III oxidase-like Fe-S oxidoreductase
MITSLMRIWLTRSLKPFKFTNIHSNSLDFETTNQLGLYVHIPFCKNICSFCPYCKFVYDKRLAEQYKEALIKEISLVGSKLTAKKEVTSLYFGGGTPALMIHDIKNIVDCIKKYFIIHNGVGVELHPDDVSEEILLLLKDAGVTMISIGIQSFNYDCLTALGRKIPDYEKIFKAINKVKFDTVDIDLIFAIPGQTGNILKNDIKTAFENGATQISTYPFIDFTFANNRYKPLPEKQKKKMLGEITQYCTKNGYIRTSVWTFAKPKTEKYSSITRENFLGFGVSATTLLKKEFKINTFSIDGYLQRIQQDKLPTSLTLNFSWRQRAVYFLFWSAYSMKIDIANFKNFFDISIKHKYWFELFVCSILKFIEKDEQGYRLTNRGAYYYHYIEQAYTTAYIDKMWNVSRIQSFPERIILK